jgi:uncharacterized protein
MMMNIQTSDDPPVTVDVLQKIKSGSEVEFERCLNDLILAAEAFDGHLGTNIFRPIDLDKPEYRIVFKFDHLSNLQRWETSPIRRRLLARIEPYAAGASRWQILTGLETWFTLDVKQPIVPPPRYKMLAITLLASFPTFNGINWLFQFLPPLPSLLRSLLGTFSLLSLMTYIIMPRMTRLFAGWLYPKS